MPHQKIIFRVVKLEQPALICALVCMAGRSNAVVYEAGDGKDAIVQDVRIR